MKSLTSASNINFMFQNINARLWIIKGQSRKLQMQIDQHNSNFFHYETMPMHGILTISCYLLPLQEGKPMKVSWF